MSRKDKKNANTEPRGELKRIGTTIGFVAAPAFPIGVHCAKQPKATGFQAQHYRNIGAIAPKPGHMVLTLDGATFAGRAHCVWRETMGVEIQGSIRT